MSNEENYFLDRNEFLELEDEDKWSYIQSLMKQIKEYKIQADKNCLECENNLLTSHDINIDMYFEDWRGCAENCDKCTKEDRIEMCDIQFNLINHIANSLANLEDKFNALTKIFLYKNQNGQELINKMKNEITQATKKSKEAQSMFQ